MEWIIIIVNIFNMLVVVWEVFVYIVMLIVEYYCLMGLKVLLLADFIFCWVQVFWEMLNWMEELLGLDVFLMDFLVIVFNFYVWVGYVYFNNGEIGLIIFIGMVFFVGGNFKELVMELIKKVVCCFYVFFQFWADSKCYLAIDFIESYFKYLEYFELQWVLNE